MAVLFRPSVLLLKNDYLCHSPSQINLLKGEIYTYGGHVLSTCELSRMAKGVFHLFDIKHLAHFSGTSVKQLYCTICYEMVFNVFYFGFVSLNVNLH